MRVLTYLFILAVIVLSLTFACLNADPVPINYYLGSKSLPLAMLLVIAFTSGCLVGLVFALGVYIKAKRERYLLNTRLKLVEKEMAALQTNSVKNL